MQSWQQKPIPGIFHTVAKLLAIGMDNDNEPPKTNLSGDAS
jgi:hypothetical protein